MTKRKVHTLCTILYVIEKCITAVPLGKLNLHVQKQFLLCIIKPLQSGCIFWDKFCLLHFTHIFFAGKPLRQAFIMVAFFENNPGTDQRMNSYNISTFQYNWFWEKRFKHVLNSLVEINGMENGLTENNWIWMIAKLFYTTYYIFFFWMKLACCKGVVGAVMSTGGWQSFKQPGRVIWWAWNVYPWPKHGIVHMGSWWHV